MALAASLVPGRLMREALDGGWTQGDGWRLVGTSFVAGVLVWAGLARTAPRLDAATAGALAACGVVLTAALVLDVKALVVADLHVVALLLLAVIGPWRRRGARPWRARWSGAGCCGRCVGPFAGRAASRVWAWATSS